jgi:hypothetical protein
VLRLRQNGTLDRTFSRDGIQSVNFAGRRYEDVYGLDLQLDGRIVAAGLSSVGFRRDDPRIAVLRLNRNGTLDRRFGKRLLKPGPNGGYARAVLADRNGGIVVGGLAYDKLDRQPGPSSAFARAARSTDRSAEAGSSSAISARMPIGSAHSLHRAMERSWRPARSTAIRPWRATYLVDERIAPH